MEKTTLNIAPQIRLEMTGREIRAWRRNRKWDGDTAPDHDRTMQRACTEFEQFRLRNASDASTFRFPPDGGGDRRMRAAGADLPSPPADWIMAAKVVALETF